MLQLYESMLFKWDFPPRDDGSSKREPLLKKSCVINLWNGLVSFWYVNYHFDNFICFALQCCSHNNKFHTILDIVVFYWLNQIYVHPNHGSKPYIFFSWSFVLYLLKYFYVLRVFSYYYTIINKSGVNQIYVSKAWMNTLVFTLDWNKTSVDWHLLFKSAW